VAKCNANDPSQQWVLTDKQQMMSASDGKCVDVDNWQAAKGTKV
jgi:hypothetical protein